MCGFWKKEDIEHAKLLLEEDLNAEEICSRLEHCPKAETVGVFSNNELEKDSAKACELCQILEYYLRVSEKKEQLAVKILTFFKYTFKVTLQFKFSLYRFASFYGFPFIFRLCIRIF